MRSQRKKWITEWFSQTIEDSHFSVKRISWIQSKEWKFINGELVHNTGRFFKIVGVVQKSKDGSVNYRPLIEQREIGTLAFMIYKGSLGTEILVQAKIEPGNVGKCQFAPSYQATASNAARIHGGLEPAYKSYFDNANGTLQSEQGTRFLGKLNRNTIEIANEKVKPTRLHKWIPVTELLELVDSDNLINTDARSVLVCAKWEDLIGKEPFTENSENLVRLLKNSYAQKDFSALQKIEQLLLDLRKEVIPPTVVPLEDLANWTISEDSIKSTENGPFEVIQIKIESRDREVTTWDQPIVSSKTVGQADLWCINRNDILYFYFLPQIEPGLIHAIELGPSVITEPGEAKLHVTEELSVIAEVLQSDEGGRFFQDSTRYRIIEVNEELAKSTNQDYWLSLGEIKELLTQGGFFTNEARSVLSLILKWL